MKQRTQQEKMRLLVLTGLFAALICLFTAYICHIPLGANGGYLHFGDTLIYVAAALLPQPYALLAAAIGGGLADLLTSPMCDENHQGVDHAAFYLEGTESAVYPEPDCTIHFLDYFHHRVLFGRRPDFRPVCGFDHICAGQCLAIGRKPAVLLSGGGRAG